MDITKENIDTLNAEVKIKLEQNDYKPQVEKVLKDYRKRATIKGFRPGMVPMGMIKKMYGKAVIVDEINKLISESLYKYLHDNKIEVLGSPLPKQEEDQKIDWENQKEFEFTYEMGLSPEIELKLQNEKITKYTIVEDDALTDKYVDYLRKRFGKFVETDVADEDDMVYGDFVELSEDSEILEGGIFKQESPVVPNTIEDEFLKKKFTGLKKGDKLKLDPKAIADNTTVLATMLGIEKAAAENVSNNFQFTVTRINKQEPAELNQELFDMVYGKDNVKNEAEFRSKTAGEALAMINGESEKKLTYDLVEKAVDKTKVPLPDEFLKRWLVQSNEKPITLEEVNDEYDNFSRSMKWQLIKNNIIKTNNIEVTKEDSLNEAKNFIKSQYAQYGQSEIPEEELKSIADKIVNNKEEVKKINENIYETRVIESLKNTVIIKDKDVTYDEFIKITNEEADKKKNAKSESGFAKFLKSGFKKK